MVDVHQAETCGRIKVEHRCIVRVRGRVLPARSVCCVHGDGRAVRPFAGARVAVRRDVGAADGGLVRALDDGVCSTSALRAGAVLGGDAVLVARPSTTAADRCFVARPSTTAAGRCRRRRRDVVRHRVYRLARRDVVVVGCALVGAFVRSLSVLRSALFYSRRAFVCMYVCIFIYVSMFFLFSAHRR